MTAQSFDYQGAKDAGYSDDEIVEYLSQQTPFDVKGATDAGYTQSEIIEFLTQQKKEPQKELEKERPFGEKAARVGQQLGLGIVESATFPAEAYLASATSQGNQATNIRNEIVKDMEWLAEKKMFGTATPEDEARLVELQELYKNPEAINEMTTDFGDLTVRRGLEKATGLDLQPEGFVEKAANIAGFLKNPSKIAKAGVNPKALIKAIAPTGKEMLKAGAMEAGLEYAEDGDFGPAGQLGMMVLGDMIAEKGVNVAKKIASPKKTIASITAKRATKKEAQELVNQLRKSGIQADLGTITNSDLVKMVQAKLDQSGLTGDALDRLRTSIFDDIKQEYKQVADSINEYKFSNNLDAGRAMQTMVEEAKAKDLTETREIWKNARELAPKKDVVEVTDLNKSVNKVLNDLKQGSIKSSEQKQVINILNDLKGDTEKRKVRLKKVESDIKRIRNKKNITETERTLLNKLVDERKSLASQKDKASAYGLVNNKIALNDIINYEAQGGTKQLLKDVVDEIGKALKYYGKSENKNFLKSYESANKRFSEHAKTFRNNQISSVLKEQNPEKLMKYLDSVEGINKLEQALSKTPDGRLAYDVLKRHKLDDIFSKSMINSLENQLKLGQFKNIFENSKNEQLIRRLLQPKEYKRLRNLSKNADAIQRAGAKFMNPSKSGVVLQDVAVIGKLIADIGHFFYGNPFPFMRTAGGVTASRYLANLMGDKEFIKLVEDMILAESKNDIQKMIEIGERLKPYAHEYSNQNERQD